METWQYIWQRLAPSAPNKYHYQWFLSCSTQLINYILEYKSKHWKAVINQNIFNHNPMKLLRRRKRVPNSYASTRTYRSCLWLLSYVMSTNSLYQFKQPSPFPGITMTAYAEHEQFLLHSSSQSARLLLVSTQAAAEVSGSITFSTFTNPSPWSHTEDVCSRFLTQPPDPSLIDHSIGYLGSNPGKQAHPNVL